MAARRVVIIGGGAAGFFAAITCAEAFPEAELTILEKGPQFLSKVRISGGGRCNVTNACADPKELSTFYPRGGRELLGPFHRFGPRETVSWFENRDVKLKTEADGRLFPLTDSSQTVIDCLVQSAKRARVQMLSGRGVDAVTTSGPKDQIEFGLALSNGETMRCDRLLVATGGCRTPSMANIPISLGHSLAPPVPSLFTFHLGETWLRELAGVSVQLAEASVPGTALRQRGPLLLTHAGLSGPAILKLSAWGARELHGRNYAFPVLINWLPALTSEAVGQKLDALRQASPARQLVNTPPHPLPARLWERIVLHSGIAPATRWAGLGRAHRHNLVQALTRSELHVTGKSLNQDEFVTCGGVPLHEVNFKTMESRIRPGLFFAGEVLDIDGLTGGFNFQAAWTTGWLAGKAMTA